MRLAAGLLAVGIIIAGLGGPLLEGVLHPGFEFSVGTESAVGLASTEGEVGHGVVPHSLVPVLSVLFLLIGAVPAYYLYIARKASPETLLDRVSALAVLYRFFWNRWLIDRFYTRVFVTGTERLATFVADELEARFDTLVHQRLPWLMTGRAERLVHRLRADTEELLYNVSYMLILFVMLLAYLFFGTGS